MNTKLVFIGNKIWDIENGSYYGDTHKMVSILCDGFDNIEIQIYDALIYHFKLNETNLVFVFNFKQLQDGKNCLIQLGTLNDYLNINDHDCLIQKIKDQFKAQLEDEEKEQLFILQTFEK